MDGISLYPYQVGGHSNCFFLSTDTNLLYKYLLPNSEEPKNYEMVLAGCPSFGSFIPHTYGTSTIENKMYLVMDNLTSSFVSPSILDIKIGKTPTFPGASKEKLEKNILKTQNTTVSFLGLRLIGIKVCNCATRILSPFFLEI